MIAQIPLRSRARMPVETNIVGEEMHHCGHCGTRTELDIAVYDGSGPQPHKCPHCWQQFVLEDEDEEPDVEFDVGEIEVVDEATGEVVGMTGPAHEMDGGVAWNDVPLANLLEEVSEDDVDHLFGIERPQDWGSF